MVFQSLETLGLVELQATLGYFDAFCELKSYFGVQRAVSMVSHTGARSLPSVAVQTLIFDIHAISKVWY